ncbi:MULTISPECIES: hypothetical protein [unclassified Coleofasciculus]|uniref:hypothetical protein n=1 Tax=Cyanophyceae TaxID=3028117 RepID=UPI0018EFA5B9|nr:MULTISPECIES: hypothetical protein [unclassified Coleofasciculus]
MKDEIGEFVKFQVNKRDRFDALCRVFYEIKKDKDANLWRDDKDWLTFFDDEALSHFWWPTEDERVEHYRRWFATPVEQRWTDPSLETPWDFESMIYAFKDGEYQLTACRMISADKARLEFYSYAYPYGSTGCMEALIEAFGFFVIAENDGTG